MYQSATCADRVRRGSITTSGTPRLRTCFDLCPEMHIGREQVGAPADHQVGLDDRFRIGAADRADGGVPCRLAATVAHRAGPQPAGAHRVEQTVRQAAVHQPLVRAVAVAEQRQRSGLGDDGLPAQRDVVERRVPGDRREPALALRANASQRRGEAFRRMHQFGVAVHFGAGKAGGERLVGIALDAHDAIRSRHAPAASTCRDSRAHKPREQFPRLASRGTGDHGRSNRAGVIGHREVARPDHCAVVPDVVAN